jgi:hypothetical protein
MSHLHSSFAGIPWTKHVPIDDRQNPLSTMISHQWEVVRTLYWIDTMVLPSSRRRCPCTWQSTVYCWRFRASEGHHQFNNGGANCSIVRHAWRILLLTPQIVFDWGCQRRWKRGKKCKVLWEGRLWIYMCLTRVTDWLYYLYFDYLQRISKVVKKKKKRSSKRGVD